MSLLDKPMSTRQVELLRRIAERCEHNETNRLYAALENLGLITRGTRDKPLKWRLTLKGEKVAMANGFAVWREIE